MKHLVHYKYAYELIIGSRLTCHYSQKKKPITEVMDKGSNTPVSLIYIDVLLLARSRFRLMEYTLRTPYYYTNDLWSYTLVPATIGPETNKDFSPGSNS